MVVTYVEPWAPYLAAGVFIALGAKALHAAFKKKEEDGQTPRHCHGFWCLLCLAVATSIDALLIGLTFVFLFKSANIFYSAALIGIITFLISFAGLFMGQKTHEKLGKEAEIVAGLILIILGIKVLF
jgi:putative Mn2+ efflux pump MntP